MVSFYYFCTIKFYLFFFMLFFARFRFTYDELCMITSIPVKKPEKIIFKTFVIRDQQRSRFVKRAALRFIFSELCGLYLYRYAIQVYIFILFLETIVDVQTINLHQHEHSTIVSGQFEIFSRTKQNKRININNL